MVQLVRIITIWMDWRWIPVSQIPEWSDWLDWPEPMSTSRGIRHTWSSGRIQIPGCYRKPEFSFAWPHCKHEVLNQTWFLSENTLTDRARPHLYGWPDSASLGMTGNVLTQRSFIHICFAAYWTGVARCTSFHCKIWTVTMHSSAYSKRSTYISSTRNPSPNYWIRTKDLTGVTFNLSPPPRDIPSPGDKTS